MSENIAASDGHVQAAMSESEAVRFRQALAFVTYEVRDFAHPSITDKKMNYLVGLAMTGAAPTWRIMCHVADGTETRLDAVYKESAHELGVRVSA